MEFDQYGNVEGTLPITYNDDGTVISGHSRARFDRPEYIEHVIADAARDLESKATPIQKAIHAVLLKYTGAPCLAWDPDQRWAIAGELARTAKLSTKECDLVIRALALLATSGSGEYLTAAYTLSCRLEAEAESIIDQ